MFIQPLGMHEKDDQIITALKDTQKDNIERFIVKALNKCNLLIQCQCIYIRM